MSWKCNNCVKIVNKPNSDTALILSKLDSIQQEMVATRNQQNEFAKSLELFGDKVDDFNKKIEIFDQKLRDVPKLQQAMIDVNSEVTQLKSEIDNLQQYLRKQNLEIQGVPEGKEENIQAIFDKILSVLEIPSDNAYDAGHRVPHFNRNDKNPRSIIIKVTSRCLKDNIIAAIRKRRGLQASDIGFSGSNNKIATY